jgi:hypothetical protein
MAISYQPKNLRSNPTQPQMVAASNCTIPRRAPPHLCAIPASIETGDNVNRFNSTRDEMTHRHCWPLPIPQLHPSVYSALLAPPSTEPNFFECQPSSSMIDRPPRRAENSLFLGTASVPATTACSPITRPGAYVDGRLVKRVTNKSGVSSTGPGAGDFWFMLRRCSRKCSTRCP